MAWFVIPVTVLVFLALRLCGRGKVQELFSWFLAGCLIGGYFWIFVYNFVLPVERYLFVKVFAEMYYEQMQKKNKQ